MKQPRNIQTGVRVTFANQRNVNNELLGIADCELRISDCVNPQSAIRNPQFILVHSFSHRGLQLGEWSHVTDTIPIVECAWRLSFSLITLQKAGHEKPPGQCSQTDP